jgi:hypothetical protein
MGVGACSKIYALQKDALARRYAIEKVIDEADEPSVEQKVEG